MSVTVEVNYEQIGIQCESVCEVAEQQLAEMDKMLDELVSTSTRLMNVQTEELQKSILAEKDKLIEQIRLVREKAATEAKQGTIHVNNHEARYNEIMAHKDDAIKAANNLQQQSNMLASQKFVEFRALIDTILSDKIASYEQKMRDRANGIVRLDMNVKALLDSIADATLRQFTYLAYLQNPDLFGDDLIAAGKTMMNTTVEERYEQEAARIRVELEASKVSSEKVKEIVKPGADLSTIREAATAEIVGEKVRQKSVKIIMKAVADRGFIVDKKNIRINRETNEVTMVALKASGEQAEFRVFLDGKFIYDFHNGYKGQACQKDSEPFMKALEEVYGMHIKETHEIWSNPDKISTMKYQAMNTNKNRG